jgi:hypothetical protein
VKVALQAPFQFVIQAHRPATVVIEVITVVDESEGRDAFRKTKPDWRLPLAESGRPRRRITWARMGEPAHHLGKEGKPA